MVRIGLSLYLMLAAVAGPWFCCCTTERLVELLALPTKQSAHSRCCTQHQHPTSQQHRGPEQHPGKPGQPGDPSCPCKEDASQPVVLATTDSDLAKQLQSRYSCQGLTELLPHVLAHFSLSPESDVRASAKGVALPFLSSHDILHAMHILRC